MNSRTAIQQEDVDDRVEEHLEYLIHEANGRLLWPQDKIDELERDIEAFREARR